MSPAKLRRRSQLVAAVLSVVLSTAVGLVGNYLVNDWTWILAGAFATLVACLAAVAILIARQQGDANNSAKAASASPVTTERQHESGISITVSNGSRLSMERMVLATGDVDQSVHIRPAGWSVVAIVGLIAGFGVALLGIPLGHDTASAPSLVPVPPAVSVTTNPDTTTRISTSDVGPGWTTVAPGQATYGWSWSAPQQPTCTQPFALMATMYEKDAHPTDTMYNRIDTFAEPGGMDTKQVRLDEYVWHDRAAAADLRAAIAEPACRTVPIDIQGFAKTARGHLIGVPGDYLAICTWESIPPGQQLAPDGSSHGSDCSIYVTVGESVVQLSYQVNLDLSGDFIDGQKLYLGLSPDIYLPDLVRLTTIAVNRVGGDSSSPVAATPPQDRQFRVYLGTRIEATTDTDDVDFTITGTDFRPKTDVYIYFGVDKVSEAEVDADGGFQQTLPMPDSYKGTGFSCAITARSAADNLDSDVLAKTACTSTS